MEDNMSVLLRKLKNKKVELKYLEKKKLQTRMEIQELEDKISFIQTFNGIEDIEYSNVNNYSYDNYYKKYIEKNLLKSMYD
jgi:hypothetical protein